MYPQSSSFSERTVQTVKDLLHKCKESGQDPHLAMLCPRSTPSVRAIARSYHFRFNYFPLVMLFSMSGQYFWLDCADGVRKNRRAIRENAPQNIAIRLT